MIIYGHIRWYKPKYSTSNNNYLTVCVEDQLSGDLQYLTVFEALIDDLCSYYKEHCYVYFKVKEVGVFKNVIEMSYYEIQQEFTESYYPDKVLKGWEFLDGQKCKK